MSWRKRALVTRGAVLATQGALVLVGIAAFVMREQLGAMTWLFALVPLAGVLVSMFWLAGQAAEEEAGEALLLAEEAIRQEAKRLDSRRAEKVSGITRYKRLPGLSRDYRSCP